MTVAALQGFIMGMIAEKNCAESKLMDLQQQRVALMKQATAMAGMAAQLGVGDSPEASFIRSSMKDDETALEQEIEQAKSNLKATEEMLKSAKQQKDKNIQDSFKLFG